MDRAEFFQNRVYELPSHISQAYFTDLGKSYPYLPGLKQEEPSVKVYNELSSGTDILAWKLSENLNPEHQVLAMEGPIVEVAGPTPLEFEYGSTNDFYSLNINSLRQGAVVTNIDAEEGVDVRADALRMPFREKSVKALVCSRIGFQRNPKKFEQMFREAERVLKEKGLFFIQGIYFENFKKLLQKTNLQIILYELRISTDKYHKKTVMSSDAVFQKQ